MPKERIIVRRPGLGPLPESQVATRTIRRTDHREQPRAGASRPTSIADRITPLGDAVALAGEQIQTRVDEAERGTRRAARVAREELTAAHVAAQSAVVASQEADRAARDATKAVGAAARDVTKAAGAAVRARAATARLAEAAAMAKTQLEVNTAALQEVARLKDEFLSTISHELRTPLQVAFGFAEVLQMQLNGPGPGPDTARLVAHIVESTGHMARLVDDLLNFVAVEHGILTVCPVDLDLTPVLLAAASSLKYVPGADRLVIVLPPAISVHADPTRVTQVATNLLANAFKYATEGQITLRVRVVKSGAVRVIVRDHGSGIPPAERQHVWKKFYRGSAARNGTPGTGIGLSVVKALVEAQGGRVGVDCRPGQGSRFWFELPSAPPA